MKDITKPKSRLPDGRANPEYTKWWFTTEKGKAHRARHAPARQVYAQRKAKEEFPTGKLICVECKSTYHKVDVIERKWKRIGNFGCVCDLCS
jgi:hypothetical protein